MTTPLTRDEQQMLNRALHRSTKRVGANMPEPTLQQPYCSQNHRDSRPTANGMMLCRNCGWLR